MNTKIMRSGTLLGVRICVIAQLGLEAAFSQACPEVELTCAPEILRGKHSVTFTCTSEDESRLAAAFAFINLHAQQLRKKTAMARKTRYRELRKQRSCYNKPPEPTFSRAMPWKMRKPRVSITA